MKKFVIFPKFYSWNTMQTRFGKTAVSGEEQNLYKQWLNLEFLFFFNTLRRFRPNSILLQGLES